MLIYVILFYADSTKGGEPEVLWNCMASSKATGSPSACHKGRASVDSSANSKIKCWVFGAWGEASEEVHGLVERVALARYNVLDPLPGRQEVPKSW